MLVSEIVALGTTSACAENTNTSKHIRVCYRNYLRVRGEYKTAVASDTPPAELPPRARRIRRVLAMKVLDHGTTSACAENTRCGHGRGVHTGNYLRVRGEYLCGKLSLIQSEELPPRARRILLIAVRAPPTPGTTSACAENTAPKQHGARYSGNYLRVRGEYSKDRIRLQRCRELPPRARRILPKPLISPSPGGTTSACAENTRVIANRIDGGWNYLRVRGEYSRNRCKQLRTGELPPRARRILRHFDLAEPAHGTTSACAENTCVPQPRSASGRNYLRVRGEYCGNRQGGGEFPELPPRARRIHDEDDELPRYIGTTSACAENTLTCYRILSRQWNYLRVRGEYEIVQHIH